MTGPRPELIVTLPGRTAKQARLEVDLAQAAGADLAEVRLDRWDPAARDRVGELFPSPVPLVATYRSRAEGGEGSDVPEERLQVLRAAARWPFHFVDLEVDRDPPGWTIGPEEPTVIRSRHLPVGSAPEAVEKALLADPAGAAFLKVVVPASVREAVGRLRAVLPSEGSRRVVFQTTGTSGPLFRAWAWTLGFPAVYSRLPETPGRSPVEPSQIPVDQLRHYLDAPTPGPLFGLVGHPIGHTRSPELFYRWMRGRGDRGLYVPLDVATEAELTEVVSALGDLGFRGLNVTRPWTQAALELASRIGPGAGPCGCANVLTLEPGGSVEAQNTDLAAILRRFRELLDASEWDGKRVSVAGSGGAARAALAAAASLGIPATVVARDLASAQRVAKEFDARAATEPPDRPAELFVNTTPVGRSEAGAPGIDFAAWFGAGTRVIDLVYDADDPLLERLAHARGASYEDGWRLLVYQAAESYALWWGSPPDDSEVDAAARRNP